MLSQCSRKETITQNDQTWHFVILLSTNSSILSTSVTFAFASQWVCLILSSDREASSARLQYSFCTFQEGKGMYSSSIMLLYTDIFTIHTQSDTQPWIQRHSFGMSSFYMLYHYQGGHFNVVILPVSTMVSKSTWFRMGSQLFHFLFEHFWNVALGLQM